MFGLRNRAIDPGDGCIGFDRIAAFNEESFDVPTVNGR
jgi:hypothetical protein